MIFLFLVIFDIWEVKEIIIKSLYLGVGGGSLFWICYCLFLRILVNYLVFLILGFIICKLEIIMFFL